MRLLDQFESVVQLAREVRLDDLSEGTVAFLQVRGRPTGAARQEIHLDIRGLGVGHRAAGLPGRLGVLDSGDGRVLLRLLERSGGVPGVTGELLRVQLLDGAVVVVANVEERVDHLGEELRARGHELEAERRREAQLEGPLGKLAHDLVHAAGIDALVPLVPTADPDDPQRRARVGRAGWYGTRSTFPSAAFAFGAPRTSKRVDALSQPSVTRTRFPWTPCVPIRRRSAPTPSASQIAERPLGASIEMRFSMYGRFSRWISPRGTGTRTVSVNVTRPKRVPLAAAS